MVKNSGERKKGIGRAAGRLYTTVCGAFLCGKRLAITGSPAMLP
nr:MAG TPA: hypothetical protein [Caudoviricetes sp.]